MEKTHVETGLRLELNKPLVDAFDPFFIVNGPNFFHDITIPNINANVAEVELVQNLRMVSRELTVEEMVAELRDYFAKLGYVINSYKIKTSRSW